MEPRTSEPREGARSLSFPEDESHRRHGGAGSEDPAPGARSEERARGGRRDRDARKVPDPSDATERGRAWDVGSGGSASRGKE